MTKIKDEELSALQGQEKAKNAILIDLGALEVQKHRLLHAFAEVQGQQEITKKSLEDNYGKVNVNLSDGSFEMMEDLEGVVNTEPES